MPPALRLRSVARALAPGSAAPPAAASAAGEAPLTIAFIGFRHGHIGAVYQAAQNSDHLEIVGVCEEDEPTRQDLASDYDFTHSDYEVMLDGTPGETGRGLWIGCGTKTVAEVAMVRRSLQSICTNADNA